MVIRHLLGAGVFCMAFSCATVFAAATASIDRTSINLAETFQLTLTLDEQSIFDKPDISVLDNDFTVLGQQKSSQSSWINGEKSAKTQWIYQLAAKRSGVITIPPIDIDGEQTQPIVIKVNAGNKQPDSDGNLQPVFMEAEVNKQDLYVQEQLLLTLRINSSLNLHNLQLDELKLDNAFIVEVSNTNYQRMLNNTPYITYEVVYAIFPQTSGQLQIPAIAVNGLYANRSSFNSFFGGGSNIHVQSEPLSVEVKEIPAQLGNADWLPAHSLHLSETWSANPENIAVGDSITRTISISAEGLSGEQLPPLLMQADSHYKTYPDQPVFNDSKTSNGITGERKDAITLVATQPGEVSLPAITVQWWDINAKALKTETLPAVTIIIRGDATVASNTPAAAQPLVSTVESLPPAAIAAPAAAASAAVSTGGHAALPWQIATAISSMAALVFMLLFFTGKAKPASAGRQAPQPAATDEKILLNALEKACAASDVAAIRSQLLAWARHNWPDARIHATGDLHYLFESNEIRDWTRKIDANLYSAGHGKENWMELYRLAAQQQAALDSRKPALLKPLYPV